VKNLSRISFSFGAVDTILFVTLVNPERVFDMCLSGLTSVTKRSVIFPSIYRIAAISIIRSECALKPVVSKSSAIKEDRFNFLNNSFLII
jgi:hypothetical protein